MPRVIPKDPNKKIGRKQPANHPFRRKVSSGEDIAADKDKHVITPGSFSGHAND